MSLPKPRAAARRLLGSSLSYDGSETTVEQYDPDRVSLPDGRISPVPLSSVLSPETQKLLAPQYLLADDEVVSYLLEHEPVTIYTDTVLLGSQEARFQFYERLARIGILGVTINRKSSLSPFFLSRKNTTSNA